MNEVTIKTTSKLDIQQACKHIIQWMKDYMNISGQKIWVIGVSGGIDSALASTLCAETRFPVLCVEMPIHQNKEHITRGQRHISWLKEKYNNVNQVETDMTKTFDVFESDFNKALSQLPFAYDDSRIELGLANTRSRMRMTALYFLSNMLGGLVCGTGNKVEDFGIGFFSLGGDGQVDISPIADLMKSEVRAMAKEMGILEEIVNAVPSDGLWDDSRSDEDQIGATYDELEWAMDFIANEGEPRYVGSTPTYPERVNLSERESEVLKIYESRHNANRHKMDSIPVCSVEKFR
ncbi:MAG: NAD(+) synthase [bacterium]|nr:NAD(+) synthase [bacterium]